MFHLLTNLERFVSYFEGRILSQGDAVVPIPSRGRAVVRAEVRHADRAAGTRLAINSSPAPIR